LNFRRGDRQTPEREKNWTVTDLSVCGVEVDELKNGGREIKPKLKERKEKKKRGKVTVSFARKKEVSRVRSLTWQGERVQKSGKGKHNEKKRGRDNAPARKKKGRSRRKGARKIWLGIPRESKKMNLRNLLRGGGEKRNSTGNQRYACTRNEQHTDNSLNGKRIRYIRGGPPPRNLGRRGKKDDIGKSECCFCSLRQKRKAGLPREKKNRRSVPFSSPQERGAEGKGKEERPDTNSSEGWETPGEK